MAGDCYDYPRGPSTNYAETEFRTAPLRQRFGLELAQLHFGFSTDIIEGLVGRYTRGKYQGQLRGAIAWTSCTHGGWLKGNGITRRGMVGNPSIIDAWTGIPIYQDEN